MPLTTSASPGPVPTSRALTVRTDPSSPFCPDDVGPVLWAWRLADRLQGVGHIGIGLMYIAFLSGSGPPLSIVNVLGVSALLLAVMLGAQLGTSWLKLKEAQALGLTPAQSRRLLRALVLQGLRPQLRAPDDDDMHRWMCAQLQDDPAQR